MFRLIVLLICLVPLILCAQGRKGDFLFHANKKRQSFHFQEEDSHTRVEIGYLVNNQFRNGVVFQELADSPNQYQLKWYYWKEKGFAARIIDTLEIIQLSDFQFIDKNEDGYADLLISTGEEEHTYRFDRGRNTLIPPRPLDAFPNAKAIGNTDFLYSYKLLGCEAEKWESRLIKIEAGKVIEYGRIFGNGCETAVEDRTITITQADIDTIVLPYTTTLAAYPDGKMGFIEEYWIEHTK